MNAVIFISGRGSLLESILKAIAKKELSLQVRAVVTNKPGCIGLKYAKEAGIPIFEIPSRPQETRAQYDARLLECVQPFHPDLLILAGFLRVLGPTFVNAFSGKLINIHPSLLPAYPGLNTHARVLAAGEKEHGATVHFVNEQLDGGPIIAYTSVSVLSSDTPETLAQRLIKKEHRLYVEVLKWFTKGQLVLQDHQVILNGIVLGQEGVRCEF